MDRIQSLYDFLSEKYNLGSFDNFKKAVEDPEKRKLIYDMASNDFELGGFDSFNLAIEDSLKKKEDGVSSSMEDTSDGDNLLGFYSQPNANAFKDYRKNTIKKYQEAFINDPTFSALADNINAKLKRKYNRLVDSYLYDPTFDRNDPQAIAKANREIEEKFKQMRAEEFKNDEEYVAFEKNFWTRVGDEIGDEYETRLKEEGRDIADIRKTAQGVVFGATQNPLGQLIMAASKGEGVVSAFGDAIAFKIPQAFQVYGISNDSRRLEKLNTNLQELNELDPDQLVYVSEYGNYTKFTPKEGFEVRQSTNFGELMTAGEAAQVVKELSDSRLSEIMPKLEQALDMQEFVNRISQTKGITEDASISNIMKNIAEQIPNMGVAVIMPVIGTTMLEAGNTYLEQLSEIARIENGEDFTTEDVLRVIEEGRDGAAQVQSSGVVSGLLDAVALGGIASAMTAPVKGLVKRALKEGVKKGLKKFSKKAIVEIGEASVKGGFWEGITEGLQGANMQFSKIQTVKRATGEKLEFDWTPVIEEALMGGIMGGIFSGAGATFNVVTKNNKTGLPEDDITLSATDDAKGYFDGADAIDRKQARNRIKKAKTVKELEKIRIKNDDVLSTVFDEKKAALAAKEAAVEPTEETVVETAIAEDKPTTDVFTPESIIETEDTFTHQTRNKSAIESWANAGQIIGKNEELSEFDERVAKTLAEKGDKQGFNRQSPNFQRGGLYSGKVNEGVQFVVKTKGDEKFIPSDRFLNVDSYEQSKGIATLRPDARSLDNFELYKVNEDGTLTKQDWADYRTTTEAAPAAEEVSLFRGTGRNVAEGKNLAMTWYAEDEEVAKNYAGTTKDGGLQVEEVKIPKPTNPLALPYKGATEVRAEDLGNILRKEAVKLSKEGKLTKEELTEASKLIADFEKKAGNDLELYTTKINKAESSVAFSEAAQYLGFDSVSVMEAATKGGKKTVTYGIFTPIDLVDVEETTTPVAEEPISKSFEYQVPFSRLGVRGLEQINVTLEKIGDEYVFTRRPDTVTDVANGRYVEKKFKTEQEAIAAYNKEVARVQKKGYQNNATVVAEEKPAVAKEAKPVESPIQSEINTLQGEVETYEMTVEDLENEIRIEKGNLKEELARISGEIKAVRAKKMSKAAKEEAIEDLQGQKEDARDETAALIEGYKEDIKANKADIRKAKNKIKKLSTKLVEQIPIKDEGKTIAKGNRLYNEPLEDATSISQRYSARKGFDTARIEEAPKLEVEKSKRIAKAFDELQASPKDPATIKAYKALAKETLEQYQAIVDEGYRVEINNDEPYASSADMIQDLKDNKRMKIFSTESGFGDQAITDEQRANNPLLEDSGLKDANGQTLLINDVFRFVHDFFGHAKFGNGFGPKGEEVAWFVHSKMYSDDARRALTTETRGQNSWVNFSGINDEAFAYRDEARRLRKRAEKETNKAKKIKLLEQAEKLVDQAYETMSFADQKIGLLPDEFVFEEAKAEKETVSIGSLDMPNLLEQIQATEREAGAKAALEEYNESLDEIIENEISMEDGVIVAQLTSEEKVSDLKEFEKAQPKSLANIRNLVRAMRDFKGPYIGFNRDFRVVVVAKVSDLNVLSNQIIGEDVGASGLYDKQSNTIFIAQDARYDRTLTHEFIHPIVFRILQNNPELAAKLEAEAKKMKYVDEITGKETTVEAWARRYEVDERQEESIVDAIALGVMDSLNKKKSIPQQIKDFFLKMLDALGIDKGIVVDGNNLNDFIQKVSEAFATGRKIRTEGVLKEVVDVNPQVKIIDDAALETMFSKGLSKMKHSKATRQNIIRPAEAIQQDLIKKTSKRGRIGASYKSQIAILNTINLDALAAVKDAAGKTIGLDLVKEYNKVIPELTAVSIPMPRQLEPALELANKIKEALNISAYDNMVRYSRILLANITKDPAGLTDKELISEIELSFLEFDLEEFTDADRDFITKHVGEIRGYASEVWLSGLENNKFSSLMRGTKYENREALLKNDIVRLGTNILLRQRDDLRAQGYKKIDVDQLELTDFDMESISEQLEGTENFTKLLKSNRKSITNVARNDVRNHNVVDAIVKSAALHYKAGTIQKFLKRNIFKNEKALSKVQTLLNPKYSATQIKVLKDYMEYSEVRALFQTIQALQHGYLPPMSYGIIRKFEAATKAIELIQKVGNMEMITDATGRIIKEARAARQAKGLTPKISSLTDKEIESLQSRTTTGALAPFKGVQDKAIAILYNQISKAFSAIESQREVEISNYNEKFSRIKSAANWQGKAYTSADVNILAHMYLIEKQYLSNPNSDKVPKLYESLIQSLIRGDRDAISDEVELRYLELFDEFSSSSNTLDLAKTETFLKFMGALNNAKLEKGMAFVNYAQSRMRESRVRVRHLQEFQNKSDVEVFDNYIYIATKPNQATGEVKADMIEKMLINNNDTTLSFAKTSITRQSYRNKDGGLNLLQNNRRPVFDLMFASNYSTNEVLSSYHLGESFRDMQATLNILAKMGNQETELLAGVLKNDIRNRIINSFSYKVNKADTKFDKAVQSMLSGTYTTYLASTRRIIELFSNAYLVAMADPDIARNIATNTREHLSSVTIGETKAIMDAIGSAHKERFNKTGKAFYSAEGIGGEKLKGDAPSIWDGVKKKDGQFRQEYLKYKEGIDYIGKKATGYSNFGDKLVRLSDTSIGAIAWNTIFKKEFKKSTGMDYDSNMISDPDLFVQYREAMQNAGDRADIFLKESFAGNAFDMNQKALNNTGTWKYLQNMFRTFRTFYYESNRNAIRSLIGKADGTMSTEEALRRLAAASGASVIYAAGSGYLMKQMFALLFQAFGMEDNREDDEFIPAMKGALAEFLLLTTLGRLPAIQYGLVSGGIRATMRAMEQEDLTTSEGVKKYVQRLQGTNYAMRQTVPIVGEPANVALQGINTALDAYEGELESEDALEWMVSAARLAVVYKGIPLAGDIFSALYTLDSMKGDTSKKKKKRKPKYKPL